LVQLRIAPQNPKTPLKDLIINCHVLRPGRARFHMSAELWNSYNCLLLQVFILRAISKQKNH